MKIREANMRHLIGGRRGLLVAALLFLFAVSLAVLRVTTLSQGFGVRLSANWAMVDFKTNVYYPVTSFWNGGNPYDRETHLALYPAADGLAPYLPSTFLLYLPFGLMPVDESALLYFVLTIALTVLLAYASFKFNDLKVSSTAVLLVAALILLSRPGQWNLLLGQLAAQSVLASYVALYYARRSPLVSGLGLAVSLLKPSFGLPLAVLMLARGDKRAVLLGTAFTAITNLPLVGVLVYRAGGARSLGEQLINGHQALQSLPDTDAATSIIRIDATALISRFVGHSLNGLAQLLVALVVLGLATLALRMTRRTEHSADAGISVSIICVAVLLSVYHQAYDLLLLTLPLVALVSHRLPSAFNAPYVRWFLLGLFAILAVNYASTESVIGSLRPERGAWLILASINSVTLLTIFLAYVLITLFKEIRERRVLRVM